MPRHSFVQMQKISNVKGRIDYISSQERQENLYATFNTTTEKFWRELAKESQKEFSKSGADGTCIEAREFIIALPEVYQQYDPDEVLRIFTESFQQEHHVECVSALHHNKSKTNYHIHLIFSERVLLKQPVKKIASRNMFYNEEGKHVRTKQKICDSNGNVRKCCRIISKGAVYESRLYSNKNTKFKDESFLEEEKKRYTQLINQYIQNSAEKLQVFEKNGVYLPYLFRQIIYKAKQRLEKFIHKFKLLLKPKLTVDIAEFQKIEVIMMELKQRVNAIYQVEYRDLPEYRRELGAVKGVFKGKECKAIKLKIRGTIEKLFAMKSNLEELVTGYGYKNVQDFAAIYKEAENQMYKYQKELGNWKEKSEAMPPEEQHIRDTLVKLETEMMERDCSRGYYRQQNKGAR